MRAQEDRQALGSGKYIHSGMPVVSISCQGRARWARDVLLISQQRKSKREPRAVDIIDEQGLVKAV